MSGNLTIRTALFWQNISGIVMKFFSIFALRKFGGYSSVG